MSGGRNCEKSKGESDPPRPYALGEGRERLIDLLGAGSGAAHASAELRVVELAAPRLANGPFDAGGAGRFAPRQPIEEDRAHGARESQEHVARSAGSRFPSRFEDLRNLAVVQAGNHGGDHHPRGHAGPRQLANRFEPRGRSARARLHPPGQLLVERCDADRHVNQQSARPSAPARRGRGSRACSW